ncbi:MAG: LamG-like jellyroll fold domain-containing protein [Bacteriovoracaceae bacterium]|nr:T9SS type A sorting domain-containing protein [Bacteroidota bacterium]
MNNLFRTSLLLLVTIALASTSGYGQIPQGKWTFDNPSNLTAAAPGQGKDLGLVGTDSAVPGPVAGNGAVRIPLGSYFKLQHGIAPNGGGTLRVNEYSMMIDFRLLDTTKWYTFYQTDTTNSNDGECFVKPNTGVIGNGSTGYSATGVNDTLWHRLVLSVKNGTQFDIYLDGVLIKAGTAQSIDSSRWALESLVLMFADNDGDDGTIDVAELALWNRPLTTNEVSELGTPIPVKRQTRWTFDNPSNLSAVAPGFGKDLVLVGSDSAVSGPSPGNGAVRVPQGSHFKLTHKFKANGGGGDSLSRVNEYSILVDFKIPDLTKWYNFFQTNPNNTDDGDCFIKKTTGLLGTTATGYSVAGIVPNEWHRMVVSVKNGTQYNYYVDGQLVHAGTVQAIDGRFALDTLLLMFADDDGEDGAMDIAELRMWNYSLSAGEVAGLGKIFIDSIVIGKWSFDTPANLHAAVSGFGNDLILVGKDSAVHGPSAGNGAVRVPKGSYLKLTHGFKPNGGGVDSLGRVNEYTLMVDFKIPDLTRWYNFYQTDTNNTNDGECFIKSTVGTVGNATTGYSTTAVTPNVWHRLAVSVKNGVHHNYYLDAKLIKAGSAAAIDDRFSLTRSLLMFGDDDGDDGEIDVAELTLWNYALSDSDVARQGNVFVTDVQRTENFIAKNYELLQNYPNPFNPSTKIDFSILADGWVSLKVYNLLGQEVATVVHQRLQAGKHIATFNGNNLSSGVYFYKLDAGSFTAIKKMMFLK